MSYHYFLEKTPTISGERLQAVAYRHGLGNPSRATMQHLLRALQEEMPQALFEASWDSPFPLVEVYSLGWTPEHEGVEGIRRHLASYRGRLDPMVLTGRDDYGRPFTVEV